MEQKKKIRIHKNGPYEVTGDIPLRQNIIEIDRQGTSLAWKDGKDYMPESGCYALCRCGHSKEKPYCDGTHESTGFEGEETASRESYLSGCTRYEGEQVDLLDNESLCAGVRFCDRGLGVWEAALESGDDQNKQLAIDESCACLSGRLTVVEKDGTAIEPDLPQEIGLVQDSAAGWRGPLSVTGGIPLEGADGEEYEIRNRMTLCRCGESKNMPFCDTSHLRCPHMRGHDT